MAANYDDVLSQLRQAGLLVDSLVPGRMQRCKVEGGGRERRGWYVLHELQLSGGDVVLVGSFGAWHGNESGATNVELRKRDADLTADQRAAIKTRIAEAAKKATADRAREAKRAAEAAQQMWSRLAVSGESDYLARKFVQGYDLRYSPNTGAAVVPLQDVNGVIHGLQILRGAAEAERAKKPAKEFWPAGVAKKGHFFLIGGTPTWVVILAEGYATGASLRAATDLPVAVAFDAGNMLPVAKALRQRYRGVRVLVAADDDSLQRCRKCKARLVLALNPKQCPECGEDHGCDNAGYSAATATALAVDGAWVMPRFGDEDGRRAQYLQHGRKLTDFNDLHAAAGLPLVRAQIEDKLSELGWKPAHSRASNTTSGDGGDDDQLRTISNLDELLARFPLVYAQGGTVFDRKEHILLSISDMRDICQRRELHRAWAEHPAREIVRIDNVDFDPSGSKPGITCNLWAGWPTTPKAGKCDMLMQMLWHMCTGEARQQATDLYFWVVKWLAYPLQHPGAKMKTAIVIHGPQGTGKNLFFDEYMSIYGQYGRVLDQAALEDKFNDWASRKLFLLADEVVARTEIYHLKNKLKALITGKRIRINPKNIAAYEEDNHANLVFLSNEAMPVVLEEDDRRHAVIWTPGKLEPEFYKAVMDEIAAGGTAALHDHLLNLPLGDFDEGTPPPQTEAKRELIELGLDSPQRFFDQLVGNEIPGLKPRPGLTNEWYSAYKAWCTQEGVRAAPMPKFVNALARKRGLKVERRRYLLEQSVFGPHGMMMLGECDPGEREERMYLGDCITAMRQELSALKGRA